MSALKFPKKDLMEIILKMVEDKASDKDLIKIARMLGKSVYFQGNKVVMEETGDTKMDTKGYMTFAEAIQEIATGEINENRMNKMRDFIGDKLDNSDMDVDQLEKAFVKKFGRSAAKHYQDLLSHFLD